MCLLQSDCLIKTVSNILQHSTVYEVLFTYHPFDAPNIPVRQVLLILFIVFFFFLRKISPKLTFAADPPLFAEEDWP